MKRPLTALTRKGSHSAPLSALVIASALLLASCNGPTTTPPDKGVTGGGTGGTLSASVEKVMTSGLSSTGASESGLLRVSSTAPTAVTVTVSDVPSGLTVTVGTPSASGSDTLVALSASGNAPSGSNVTVSISAGSKSATLTVPVLNFQTYAITPEGLTTTAAAAPYLISSIRPHADGSLLMRAPASGNEQQRHSLVRFDPKSGKFSLLSFPIPGLETITSHAVTPDGRIWVTVRGVTAAGSYLMGMNSAGQTEKFLAKTTDTLNGLTSTPDGQLWYTQYTNDSVVSLNPATSALTPHAVEENADNLILAADGNLYHNRYYTKPAIVQRNPANGATKAFSVGTPDVSLPMSLTAAPDGSIWFIETRTSSVWNLNPSTGKQTQVTLPSGARPTELAAAPDGTLWIADPGAGQLYKVASGQWNSTTIPALKTTAGTPNGPHALTVTPEGKLWYEADGKLVTLN